MTISVGIDVGTSAIKTVIIAVEDGGKRTKELAKLTHKIRQRDPLKLAGEAYDEALADAERAVSLDPGDAGALTALSGVLTTIGRPKEAIEFAERAMRVDPVFPGDALIRIGKARYAMGDMQAALSMAKRGTEHVPKITGYRALTAAIYARLGRDEEAQKEFEFIKVVGRSQSL